MAKLVVISESLKDQTFELSGDSVTIGRLSDNQIYLEDNTISSHHAELILKGEDYVVRDLNSTNGTRVNGQRVVETCLYHGDVITFGNLQLQYSSSSKKIPMPLPSPLKRSIDLGGASLGTTTRPLAYGSSSPFAKQPNRFKALFQIIIIVLGVTAIVLLALFIRKLLAT